MTHPDEESILENARLILDAVALSEAMLAGDVEEARFRAQLIAIRAPAMRRPTLLAAARRVVDSLGTSGHAMRAGYAEAIDDLSLEIDRLGIGSEEEP